MPLHVTININREVLETLHIGRIEGGEKPDDINKYLVVVGEKPWMPDAWKMYGVEYEHRYGDGALVCVRKALDALENNEYKRLGPVFQEMLHTLYQESPDGGDK